MVKMLPLKHLQVVALNTSVIHFHRIVSFSRCSLQIHCSGYRFVWKKIDGGIFSSSKMGKALEGKKLNVPEERPLPITTESFPHIIAGD
jgi:hypothetical protein